MLCMNACRRRNMCIEVTRAAQLPLGRGWEFGQQCRGVLGAPWRAKQASSAICRRSCVSVARSCLGSASWDQRVSAESRVLLVWGEANDHASVQTGSIVARPNDSKFFSSVLRNGAAGSEGTTQSLGKRHVGLVVVAFCLWCVADVWIFRTRSSCVPVVVSGCVAWGAARPRRRTSTLQRRFLELIPTLLRPGTCFCVWMLRGTCRSRNQVWSWLMYGLDPVVKIQLLGMGQYWWCAWSNNSDETTCRSGAEWIRKSLDGALGALPHTGSIIIKEASTYRHADRFPPPGHRSPAHLGLHWVFAEPSGQAVSLGSQKEMVKAKAASRGDQTKEERKRVRKFMGTLKSLTVQPKMRARYAGPLQRFFEYLQRDGISLPTVRDSMDAIVSDYIELLWSEGEGRAEASNALAALQDADPKLHGCLPGAWRLLRTWNANEMQRAPPLTESVLSAMVGWAITHEHYEL